MFLAYPFFLIKVGVEGTVLGLGFLKLNKIF
jgi:hypothetical protein